MYIDFESLFHQWIANIPDYLAALILLAVGYVAANFVKGIVGKLLKKLDMKKLGDNEESVKNFITKAVFLVIFALFLPTVFNLLDLGSIANPISNLLNVLVNYIPNVVAAGIVMCVGIFLAKTARDLLLPLLKLSKIDSLQEKAGIQVNEKNSLSGILSNVVYAFGLMLVIVTALDYLAIPAISAPLSGIVNTIFGFVPNLLAALAVIVIGLFVVRIACNLLENLLAGIGTDKLAEKICAEGAKKVKLSHAIATIVKVVLAVVVFVQGLNLLNLPVIAEIGNAILGYIPTALSVVLILAAGFYAAKAAAEAIQKAQPNAKAAPLAAKGAIYVVTGFITLSQLNIANNIVENTFILIVAAVCVAAALAFGIGGKNFAANMLAKLEEKIK